MSLAKSNSWGQPGVTLGEIFMPLTNCTRIPKTKSSRSITGRILHDLLIAGFTHVKVSHISAHLCQGCDGFTSEL